jgi:hypothetical protein
MHMHNVNDYAPEGYRLAASNMEQGKCSHVFVAEGKPELRCEGSWSSADEEREALTQFHALHEVARDLVADYARAATLDRPNLGGNVAAAQARDDESLAFNSNALAAKPKPAPKKPAKR